MVMTTGTGAERLMWGPTVPWPLAAIDDRAGSTVQASRVVVV